MTVYTLDEVTKDVRIALDQNMISEPLVEIGDVDTLSVNEIIKSKIVEAVKRIHVTAPFHLLDGGYNFGDDIYWMKHESGYVTLPDDFMRLLVFKMDDWERAVFSALVADDPKCNILSSRFKGIRGTAQRPVCVISRRPEKRVLEFYSCKSEDAKVSRAVYIPYPKIDEHGGVEICEKCYNSVIYTIASLTLTAFGDNEKSALFDQLATSSLI